MADVQHAALTDPELHEPKGASTATAGQVYVADGAGHGAWAAIDLVTNVSSGAATASQIPTADGAGSFTFVNTVAPNKLVLTYTFFDVSAPSSQYLVVPFAGTLVSIYSVLEAAITVADSNVTFSNSSGAITGSALVISFTGSAPGDVDSSSPSANNVFAAGDYLRITSDGGSTTTANLSLSFVFTL